MDRISQLGRMFTLSVQSSCLVALLNSSNGQIFFLKSPDSDTVPVREQKMVAIVASSAIYAKMSGKAEVAVEQAAGTALHIVWKSVTDSVIVLLLGSVNRFHNIAVLDDAAAMIGACCRFLFGQSLFAEEGSGSLRMHHALLVVLGKFIDTLFSSDCLAIDAIDERENEASCLPLTFLVPFVETLPSGGSVDALLPCLTAFCESVGAYSGALFSSGRIALISPQLLETLDTLHLRCFVVLCLSVNNLALQKSVESCKNAHKRSSSELDSSYWQPASLTVFFQDRCDKSKFDSYLLLCSQLTSDETSYFGAFLFSADKVQRLLPENVAAEITRYWGPIISNNVDQDGLIPSVGMGIFSLVDQIIPGSSSLGAKKGTASGKVLPIVMCVASEKYNLCFVISPPNQNQSARARLVSLMQKACKFFSTQENASYAQSQPLSRRPSAFTLRYSDCFCVAVVRSPISAYAVMPPSCHPKEAIQTVADLGLEYFFASHSSLCN